MKEERVSIIVPIYNSENTIQRCIDSLIFQTYESIEILLIDDGSTDNSKKICEKYTKKENVEYYFKSNGGVSSSRNLGIEKSTGKYIFFVDSDDTIDRDLIEMLIKEKNSHDVLVGCNINVFEKDRNIIEERKNEYNTKEFILDILIGKIGGYCCGYLFEKKKIKKFDTSTHYMEDTIFLLDYLENEGKVKFCNSCYNYIVNNSSITKNNSINNIKKNLVAINYSLNLIEEKLKLYGITEEEIKKLIINKKAKVIESECSKLNSSKKIIEMLDEDRIKQIIEELEINSEKVEYRIFFKMVLHKRYFLLRIYLLIRKVLKLLKRR